MDAFRAKVYVVGAGPGDPELLTIKAKKLIQEADVIVYAGSLINKEILDYAKNAIKINSYGKRLSEIVDIIRKYALSGRKVVRLSSGDPSIYSSLKELREELDLYGIDVEVVPGISAFSAASAVIGEELTVPEGPQSVVLTRISGNTPVRESESLEHFASTGASIVLFLSASRLDEIREKALRGGMDPDTDVVVAYKVTWKEQRIFYKKLRDLKNIDGVSKTAVVMILPGRSLRGKRSYLYGNVNSEDELKRNDEMFILPVMSGEASSGIVDKLMHRFVKANLLVDGPIRDRIESVWDRGLPIIFIGPLGVCVRVIAPFIKSKRSDPPVIVVDISGSFCIPVIGGHKGANRLCKDISKIIGAVPVVTTGTEALGKVSIEEIAYERGLEIIGGSTLDFNRKIITGEKIFSCGLGWHEGESEDNLKAAVDFAIEKAGGEVSVFAVLSERKDKQKLLNIIPEKSCLVAVPKSVLSRVKGNFSPSRARDFLEVAGVCEPAAIAVLPEGARLFMKKTVLNNITVALGIWEGE